MLNLAQRRVARPSVERLAIAVLGFPIEVGIAAEQDGPAVWILLLYRLADEEVIAGFGYVDDPTPGMLDRETLIEFVGNMVEMDLEPGAVVDEEAAAHGGVALAPELTRCP